MIFEYKTVRHIGEDASHEELLNNLGQYGYELINMRTLYAGNDSFACIYTFKKQKEKKWKFII